MRDSKNQYGRYARRLAADPGAPQALESAAFLFEGAKQNRHPWGWLQMEQWPAPGEEYGESGEAQPQQPRLPHRLPPAVLFERLTVPY